MAPGDRDGDVEAAADDLDGNRAELEAVLLDDPFSVHLGAQVTAWGGGWAEAELTLADHHTNLARIAHGGVTFGLGDVVFALSSNSWGRLAVALAVDIQFLRAAEAGQRLLATSRERHRTRRTAAYLVEVRSRPSDIDSRSRPSDIESRSRPSDLSVEGDEAGELVASLHAMVHRTDRWHLGEDAWSEAWRRTH